MTTNQELLDKLDFKKGNGLIPVVVQDAKTKEVLMLAYANSQSVEHTLSTGKGTYWMQSNILESLTQRTLGERRNLGEHSKSHFRLN